MSRASEESVQAAARIIDALVHGSDPKAILNAGEVTSLAQAYALISIADSLNAITRLLTEKTP